MCESRIISMLWLIVFRNSDKNRGTKHFHNFSLLVFILVTSIHVKIYIKKSTSCSFFVLLFVPHNGNTTNSNLSLFFPNAVTLFSPTRTWRRIMIVIYVCVTWELIFAGERWEGRPAWKKKKKLNIRPSCPLIWRGRRNWIRMWPFLYFFDRAAS